MLAASGPVAWRHAKWSWLSLAKMDRWGDLTKFQSPEHRGNQRKCTETISASKSHSYIATNFSFVSSIPHVLVEYRRQNSPTILQHFGFCGQNSPTSLQSFGFCEWQVQWVHLSPNEALRSSEKVRGMFTRLNSNKSSQEETNTWFVEKIFGFSFFAYHFTDWLVLSEISRVLAMQFLCLHS